MLLLGLRTVIYPAPNLEASKRWFEEMLSVSPYFDQPFYVGFNVAGYELGLDPDGDPAIGPIAYWGVADADTAHTDLIAAGASEHSPVRDVGDGIRVASVVTPAAGLLGVIENPHFQIVETRPASGAGR